MSRFLFYPHVRGVIQRLPEHFKARYLQRCRANDNLKYIAEIDDTFIEAANKSLYVTSLNCALLCRK